MLTLLKFHAEWCNPCKAMAPIVEQIKDEYSDTLIVQDVNIDDNPQLRADYSVRSIPTFVLIKDGKEIDRKNGSGTLSEMMEWLDVDRRV